MKKFYAMGILSVLNFSCSQNQQSTTRQAQDGGIKNQQHSWIEMDDSKSQEAAAASQESEQLDTISSTPLTPEKKEKLLEEIKSEEFAQSTQPSEIQVVNEANSTGNGLSLVAVNNNKPVNPPAAPEKADAMKALVEACSKALDLDGYPNFAIYNFEAKTFNKVVLSVPSSETYAIVRFKAEKRLNNLEVKLTNPKGKYCFELSAGNNINKIKVTSPCTATVRTLSITAKRWNKVDLNLCN